MEDKTKLENAADIAADQLRRIEDAWEEDARENKRFPKVLKAYGILLILSGLAHVLIYAFAIVATAFVIYVGQTDTLESTVLANNTNLSIVISGIQVVLVAVIAVANLVLGVRLIRNNRRNVARSARFRVILQVVSMVCSCMLFGLSVELISSCVSIAILVCLEIYADPSLRQERIASRKAQQLERKADQESGVIGLDKTGKGFIELNFFNLFWMFVVCSFLGLMIEIIYHMTVVDPGVYQDRAGLLYGPFSPIYGFGGVFITIALNRFYKKNPFVVFLAAGFIGAAFEYAVSWWMEYSFGIKAWDYSGTFLNIDGRTNFKFFCMWGALGIMWLRFILPRMIGVINSIPWNLRYSITVVCTVVMLLDCGLTVAAMDCWYLRQAGAMDPVSEQSAIERFCNEHYDDAYMQQRFQTMHMNVDKAARVK